MIKHATTLAAVSAVMLLGSGPVGVSAASASTATAIFAGGCFWSTESDFDHVKGVTETTSGYIGGHVANPTYRQVTSETTGHREAVRIAYDPSVVSYDQLLTDYWHSIDPTDFDGQVTDHGESYHTGIFATTPDQMKKARATKTKVAKDLGKPIATTVAMAPTFYPAEAYHQNYHNTKPGAYLNFRNASGHDAKIRSIWGDKAYTGIPNHQ